MKHAFKHMAKGAIVALLATAAQTPVLAEDDKSRFESTGFLQSLDILINEHAARSRVDQKLSDKSTIEDITLSLRNKAEKKESGFFYLRDPRNNQSVGSTAGSPDFTSLLAPGGFMRGANDDILGTSTRLGMMFGGDKTSKDVSDRGLEVAFETGYRLSQPSGFDGSYSLPFTSTNLDLAARQMNLGVSVGYSGFNLDASMMRETSAFADHSSSLDFGLSYRTNSWSARLSLSEYKKGADLLRFDGDARNILSLSLGGSYQVSRRFGLLGGVRYYDYGNQYYINPAFAETDAQLIFLGGRLSF